MRLSKSTTNQPLIYWLTFTAILLLLVSQQTKAAVISIDKVADYHQDKQLMIDSESSFQLPEHVIKAVHHEVPLHFQIEIELSEASSLFGFKYQRIRNRIDFHTELKASGVNRLYSLHNTRNQKTQSFKSLDEALKTLSTLHAFPIASLSELHPKQSYTLRMRIRLDIIKLPAPLMIEAIFTDRWQLDSQWYETTLQTPLSWQ